MGCHKGVEGGTRIKAIISRMGRQVLAPEEVKELVDLGSKLGDWEFYLFTRAWMSAGGEKKLGDPTVMANIRAIHPLSQRSRYTFQSYMVYKKMTLDVDLSIRRQVTELFGVVIPVSSPEALAKRIKRARALEAS